MNEFVTYILVSESNPGKIYIGYTSDLINRIASHNHFATKGHTLRFCPWKVQCLWFFNTKDEALKQEKFLKSGVGRRYIREKLEL